MRTLRNIPIRRKLMLVIMLTSAFGLLLAGSLTILHEWESYRRLMTEDLSTMAEVIGDQSTAALSFNDPKAARENLGALQAKPEVVAAAIYTPAGGLFAEYHRRGQREAPVPVKAEAAGHRFHDGYLELFRPIRQRDEKLGMVYVYASLERLRAQLIRYAEIVVAAIVCLLLVTLLVSGSVQRAISDPILDLASVAREVSEGKNYALRAPGQGRDEIGQLINTFNQMLVQIEGADTALRGANAALEEEIVERKRAESALHDKSEEVRSMTQQLWQTAKLATMGELAANIAHELNNPLATVSLKIESLLAQNGQDDVKRRTLETMEQEVDRMSGLVANLLQFSRRSRQQISSLDIRAEIRKTLDLLQTQLRNRCVEAVCDFAPDVAPVYADSQQLQQLFLNLFTNAADAMPQGGELTVRVRQEGDGVMTQVQDTGTGIGPEDLPVVMEPFFTTKPKGKGTGLGLGICRRIVQEHRGTFDISSELGQGTVVTIILPSSSEDPAVVECRLEP